ncbi:hypothetical protein OESDEN_22320 [Oesophagostomum dentatum]|uniref:Uncharacterized protein n=1 Tax=Oesophagostomum dentatum TaxID=61180 RepID=A0A0B1S4B5_OESDE|nr:hypothetical protein OESDEN_22320 [Oesophagostomum dentatum]
MFLYSVPLLCLLVLSVSNAFPNFHTSPPSSSNGDSYPDYEWTDDYDYATPMSLPNDELPAYTASPTSGAENVTEPSSINSLQITGYLNEYELDDREYDKEFFKATLREIETDMDDSTSWQYEILSHMPLFNGNYEGYTFKFLAMDALGTAKGLKIEASHLDLNLTKFVVANLIHKHVLCYLTAKKHLAMMEDEGYSTRSEKKELKKILEVLEETITRGDEPYYEVQNAIKKLQWYGEIYHKIYEEQQWIQKKIDDALKNHHT